MPDRKPLVAELKFQKEQMKLVTTALEDAASDIRQQILRNAGGSISERVTLEQMKLQERGIKATLSRKFDDFEQLLQTASEEMAGIASEVISDYTDPLTDLVLDPARSKQLRESEARRVVNNIQQLISRNTTAQPGLSNRVYGTRQVANGMIDKTINRALAQGMNARQFANAVRSQIDPKVKGGVSYAAMRLARTEINNASHAASVQRYKEIPFIEGVDWNLSGSHPEGDECDGLKDNGPYDTEEVPAKPHPQCFCYLTPALPDEDDFMKNLFDGKYDDGEDFGEDPSPTKVALNESAAGPAAKRTGLDQWSKEDIADLRRRSKDKGLRPSTQQIATAKGDPILNEIRDMQGFKGRKPTRASIPQNEALWRGFREKKHIDSFTDADQDWAGTGWYGSGSYFASNDKRLYALNFAKGDESMLLKTRLKSDARILELEQVSYTTDKSSMQMWMEKNHADIDARTDITKADKAFMKSMTKDPGRAAAMSGYDGMKVNIYRGPIGRETERTFESTEYVMHNRGAMEWDK